MIHTSRSCIIELALCVQSCVCLCCRIAIVVRVIVGAIDAMRMYLSVPNMHMREFVEHAHTRLGRRLHPLTVRNEILMMMLS